MNGLQFYPHQFRLLAYLNGMKIFLILYIEKLQVKAFLRGDTPPYSAGDLEGMTFIASMHVKVARRLHSNSLRYWLLEYLRRQPKGRKYKALILKFIKGRMATLLLVDVSQHTTYYWCSLCIAVLS
jgi:hypothetical protein